ncbi:MAG: sugar ABC transporter ATP-binding protein [Ktedonobacteraceae bacterium]|nr:sugar ABC transporter ATP-binding protein [Ktedonobacteraceae bacterium]
MEPSKPIVELTGITRRFGTIQALRGVSLNLYPGEVHAIVGENGAGKSTLVKILAGIHQPDSGLIQVDGQDVELQTPAQAQQLGIAVIHQEPTLFPDLDVAENIFMGRHPRDRLGRINWRQMYREVEQLLTTLGVHLSVYAPVRGLSVADQQLVEIAKALSVEARVLVMDEPTAALSPHEVQQLFTIINQLRRRGTAILFISHRLDEVFALADRITILRDGACITSALASELTLESTIRHMVGRELGALFPKEAAEIGELVLDVRHLTRRGVFENISFQVRQSEIVGFAGLIGSGRTEVARVLFGIDRPDSGEIWICGQRISVRSPQQAMQHGIAYVPEGRMELFCWVRQRSLTRIISTSLTSERTPSGIPSYQLWARGRGCPLAHSSAQLRTGRYRAVPEPRQRARRPAGTRLYADRSAAQLPSRVPRGRRVPSRFPGAP